MQTDHSRAPSPQHPSSMALALQGTKPLPAPMAQAPEHHGARGRITGDSPVPQSMLKLCKPVNPTPAYLPHLFLPSETTGKFPAHVSPSLCLLMTLEQHLLFLGLRE